MAAAARVQRRPHRELRRGRRRGRRARQRRRLRRRRAAGAGRALRRFQRLRHARRDCTSPGCGLPLPLLEKLGLPALAAPAAARGAPAAGVRACRRLSPPAWRGAGCPAGWFMARCSPRCSPAAPARRRVGDGRIRPGHAALAAGRRRRRRAPARMGRALHRLRRAGGLVLVGPRRLGHRPRRRADHSLPIGRKAWNKAIAILKSEHRSISAVLQA